MCVVEMSCGVVCVCVCGVVRCGVCVVCGMWCVCGVSVCHVYCVVYVVYLNVVVKITLLVQSFWKNGISL